MARAVFAWVALLLTIATAVEDAADANSVAPNPFDAPTTHEVAHRHRKHTHAESATCYGRRYPDLAYAFCKDECNVRKLHDHFRDHGRREGRRFGCEAAPLTAAETAKWKVHEARLRAGPGQELVRLKTGKLGGLGMRGKRISGADLVAMYAAASHFLCRGASARE